ncbi:MAG: response regulator [Pseudomonadota bacterium]
MQASACRGVSEQQNKRVASSPEEDSKCRKKMGRAVVVAENGLKALDHPKSERLDPILMDVQRPVIDGVETTRRIREDESGLFDPRIP